MFKTVILATFIAIGQQKKSLRTRKTPRLRRSLIFLLVIRVIVVIVVKLASQVSLTKPRVGLGEKTFIYRGIKNAILLTPQLLISILSQSRKRKSRQ